MVVVVVVVVTFVIRVHKPEPYTLCSHWIRRLALNEFLGAKGAMSSPRHTPLVFLATPTELFLCRRGTHPSEDVWFAFSWVEGRLRFSKKGARWLRRACGVRSPPLTPSPIPPQLRPRLPRR